MKNMTRENNGAARSIARATAVSFTICVLCWSTFELLPNWDGTGMISIFHVVSAVWVSLGICLCVSIWGYLCFSEVLVKKFSKLVRFLAFAVVGYGIIAAWVFGSGWCPIEGFWTFTIICIAAFAFAGAMNFISSARANARLQRQLEAYKDSKN